MIVICDGWRPLRTLGRSGRKIASPKIWKNTRKQKQHCKKEMHCMRITTQVDPRKIDKEMWRRRLTSRGDSEYLTTKKNKPARKRRKRKRNEARKILPRNEQKKSSSQENKGGESVDQGPEQLPRKGYLESPDEAAKNAEKNDALDIAPPKPAASSELDDFFSSDEEDASPPAAQPSSIPRSRTSSRDRAISKGETEHNEEDNENAGEKGSSDDDDDNDADFSGVEVPPEKPMYESDSDSDTNRDAAQSEQEVLTSRQEDTHRVDTVKNEIQRGEDEEGGKGESIHGYAENSKPYAVPTLDEGTDNERAADEASYFPQKPSSHNVASENSQAIQSMFGDLDIEDDFHSEQGVEKEATSEGAEGGDIEEHDALKGESRDTHRNEAAKEEISDSGEVVQTEEESEEHNVDFGENREFTYATRSEAELTSTVQHDSHNRVKTSEVPENSGETLAEDDHDEFEPPKTLIKEEDNLGEFLDSEDEDNGAAQSSGATYQGNEDTDEVDFKPPLSGGNNLDDFLGSEDDGDEGYYPHTSVPAESEEELVYREKQPGEGSTSASTTTAAATSETVQEALKRAQQEWTDSESKTKTKKKGKKSKNKRSKSQKANSQEL
eukprot:gb/GECG01014450.1/.p1 GENE.gb/GECG01014450.1/~~gb/GECG01014450.1/.p1  ORF type:complete len:609 (+),score=153.29 gb/GECG01014450.1/:1-1827(+)